jgi:hypothetical protein
MPFHLWGLLGDHDQHFCELYYHCYDTTNFTHFYFIYHVCIITDQSLTDMPLHSILTLRSIHFPIVLYFYFPIVLLHSPIDPIFLCPCDPLFT